MALPIAHGTVGYLLHRLDGRRTRFEGWSRALTFIAIANLPDIDFIFGFLLGRPGAFHRGVTHTVFAALAFGAAAGLFCRWRFDDRWLPASLMFAAVYASHLLVDSLTIDVRGPAGAQFFWPLSDRYYIAPFWVFREIIIDGSSRVGFLHSVLAWPTVLVLAREMAIAVAMVVGIHVLAPWLRGQKERAVGIELAAKREEDLA